MTSLFYLDDLYLRAKVLDQETLIIKDLSNKMISYQIMNDFSKCIIDEI